VREDAVRKDLLFAGTENGLYISLNGGQQWMPFQLNLPVTPIMDLKIHDGDLIAATSGRSFWILDDLGLVRQFKSGDSSMMLFKPEDAINLYAYSELDRNTDQFTGANPYIGVNPASGVVIYYQLPALKDSDNVTLEIRDAKGNLVRTFSSKKDSTYISFDGAPPQDPVLTKKKGLNRFVWNMRYSTISAVPNLYMENSYSGHKASPGVYTLTLITADKTVKTDCKILKNPLYVIDENAYEEYHKMMLEMETTVSSMHKMVNLLYARRLQLESLLADLPADEKYAKLKKDGEAIVKDMKKWDEDMVQRKSKSYDDVENFPNKFTANYMFLINQTESEIPRVNQSSVDLRSELDAEWTKLQARANDLLNNRLPAYNKELWNAGVGAIWKK
jgi:hypothetical protein